MWNDNDMEHPIPTSATFQTLDNNDVGAAAAEGYTSVVTWADDGPPPSRMMDNMPLNMNSTIRTFDGDSKWDQSTIRSNFGPSDGGGGGIEGYVSTDNNDRDNRCDGLLTDEIREGPAPPPRYPPYRISRRSRSSSSVALPTVKLSSPRKTRATTTSAAAANRPGRLFVRMPATGSGSVMYRLGEFNIGLEFAEIESYHVEKARRKLEKRAERMARKNRGGPAQIFGANGGGGDANNINNNNNNANNNKAMSSPTNRLEQRDEVETTAVNARQNVEAKAMEVPEVPKLASLLIQHGSFPARTPAASPAAANDARPPAVPSSRADDDDDDVADAPPPLDYKTIWSSSPGISFVGATHLSSVDVQNNGTVAEQVGLAYRIQTVDSIRRGPSHVITVMGCLGHSIVDGELPADSPRYTLAFQLVPETKALKFTLRVEGGEIGPGCDRTANGAQLFNRMSCEEAFFGMGARFGKPNLKGQEVTVCHPSNSDSSGGGGGTATGGGTGSGGNQYYSPKNTSNSSTIPHFVSSAGVSLHLHTVEPTLFDFTNRDYYSVRTPCSVLAGTFLSGTSILHALELHTGLVGRTKPLPKWTQRNGILAGMRGGTDEIRSVCKNLFERGCSVAGVLIGDWTGVKSSASGYSGSASSIGGGANNSNNSGHSGLGSNSSWYNYVLEREHYTGWQSLMDSLERRGISVGLYLSPYLEEIPMHLRSGRRYLFGEATAGDYFVKRRVGEVGGGSTGTTTAHAKKSEVMADKFLSSRNVIHRGGGSIGGSVGSLTPYNHFKKGKCGMIDPTNPSAASWFKRTVKEELLDYASASFWLASAGTGPPMDARYTSASNDGLAFHNSYGEKWAELNRDAIREAGRDGDSFFIVDSAFGGSAKHAGTTCLGGDRIANFHRDANDGNGVLRSILNGIVNGGFSGLTHGHCAVSVAVPRQLKSSMTKGAMDSKSREMICRWFEMTAFTALFRTHDGGSCGGSGGMSCAYDDGYVMDQLARWSDVYVALAEYRLQLLNEASFQGYPVVRHPVLHFPNEERFNCCSSRVGSKKQKKKSKDTYGSVSYGDDVPSFMLGDLIYVVPVVKSGVVKTKVYLPSGGWIHLWTEEQVAGPHNIGKTIEVMAPVGEPPVFIRDCDMMHRFMEELRQGGIIGTGARVKEKSSSMFSSFRRK